MQIKLYIMHIAYVIYTLPSTWKWNSCAAREDVSATTTRSFGYVLLHENFIIYIFVIAFFKPRVIFKVYVYH